MPRLEGVGRWGSPSDGLSAHIKPFPLLELQVGEERGRKGLSEAGQPDRSKETWELASRDQKLIYLQEFGVLYAGIWWASGENGDGGVHRRFTVCFL